MYCSGSVVAFSCLSVRSFSTAITVSPLVFLSLGSPIVDSENETTFLDEFWETGFSGELDFVSSFDSSTVGACFHSIFSLAASVLFFG